MIVAYVRRHADSQYSRAIYEAIKLICYQRQCPNEERILRFVLREFDWNANDISRQLRLVVKDGLLREVTATSHKGGKKGATQLSYRLHNSETEPDLSNETHDWYCFDCQESGEVVLCDFCPRVFHKKCANISCVSGDKKWKCPSCKVTDDMASKSKMSLEEVNNMLKFTINRMEEKFKDIKQPVSLDACPDYPSYIFHPTDLSCISEDIDQNKFTSPSHFLEEVKWLLHNSIIYFGDDDELTIQAEELVEDAKQEVEEMFLCPNCYNLSNSKPKNWFCKPCDPPHEVVWAKMTGQPPWPAKILKWNDDKSKALVRFFEQRHQRAWVYLRHISPINVKPDAKKLPRTWFDAQHELHRYLRELGDANGKDNTPDELGLNDLDLDELAVDELAVDELAVDELAVDELDVGELDENLNAMDTEVKIEPEEKPSSPTEEEMDEGNDPCFDQVAPSPSLSCLDFTTSCHISCQTDEDPSRGVIDKLRKRIDDLEHDLRETKQKLDLKDARDLECHEQGKILTLNTNIKVEKLLSALRERWQRDFEISELTEEQIRRNFEKEQAEYNRKLEEQRLKIETEKKCEIERLKAAMQVKHDSEISELRERVKMEKDTFLDALKKRFDEEKRREVEETKLILQRQFENELKIQRGVLERQHSEVVAELKRQEKLMLMESIRETKKKQWCCNCEQEACYPCCWNTSYCSRQCQVVHWQQHRHQCSRNLVYLAHPHEHNRSSSEHPR